MRGALRYVCWPLLLFAFSASGEEVRQELVERVARDFREWIAKPVPNSHLDGRAAQERYLQTFLDNPETSAARGGLSYEEYLALRSRLNAQARYMLGPPPLDVADYTYRQTVVATRPSQWRPERLFERQLELTPGPERTAELSQQSTARAPRAAFKIPNRLPHYYYFDTEGKMRRAAHEESSQPITVSLNQRGDNSLDLAMQLIASTDLGKSWLERFLKMYQRNEVVVRPLTADIRAESSVGLNGSCSYETRTGQTVIYVDPLEPVGRLAAALLHEMVHAVSPNHRAGFLREAKALEVARWSTDPEEKKRAALLHERGVLEREKEAHGQHQAFVAEVARRFRPAKAFYEHLDRTNQLSLATSEADLIHSYALRLLEPAAEAPIDLRCSAFEAMVWRPLRRDLNFLDLGPVLAIPFGCR